MKRVLSRKSAKTVYKVNSSRPKENIPCIGVNGSMLKTHVILKEKFTRMEDFVYASGIVNGHFFLLSAHTYYKYATHHFWTKLGWKKETNNWKRENDEQGG